MPETTTDRRRFDRIATDKPVTVRDGSREHHGMVLDVSLRGLLFAVDGDWRPSRGGHLQVCIELDGDGCGIVMDGEVAHLEGNHVGMHCLQLDVESAGRLRRMVELNLADHDLLERNLAELIAR